MKSIYGIILIIFLLMGCSHADYIGFGVMVGDDTKASAFGSHVEDGEDVDLYGVHVEAGKIKNRFRYGIEGDISHHKYSSNDPEENNKKFLAIDVGLFGTYDFIHKETWQIYGGLGAGLGYVPMIDSGYPLVGDSGAVGVFDYRVGWRKKVKWGEVSLEYKSKHWSDPLNRRDGKSKSDVGENDDVWYLKFSIPLGR